MSNRSQQVEVGETTIRHILRHGWSEVYVVSQGWHYIDVNYPPIFFGVSWKVIFWDKWKIDVMISLRILRTRVHLWNSKLSVIVIEIKANCVFYERFKKPSNLEDLLFLLFPVCKPVILFINQIVFNYLSSCLLITTII